MYRFTFSDLKGSLVLSVIAENHTNARRKMREVSEIDEDAIEMTLIGLYEIE